jgi:hypothetical protein
VTDVIVPPHADGQRSSLSSTNTGLLAGVADPVVIVSGDGDHLYRNPAAIELLERRLGIQHAGDWRRCFELLRADGCTPVPVAELPLPLSPGGACHADLVLVARGPAAPDGLRLVVAVRPLDPCYRIAGAIVTFRDAAVTQDGQRERHAAEQLQLLLDGAHDHAILMLDRDGRVQTWSEGARRLKGLVGGRDPRPGLRPLLHPGRS